MNKSLFRFIFLTKQRIHNKGLINDLKISRTNLYLGEENLSELQFQKLFKLVKFAYEKSQFYNELYDNAGFHPSKLKSFNDIEKIPLITNQNIRESFEQIIPRARFNVGIAKACSRVAFDNGLSIEMFRSIKGAGAALASTTSSCLGCATPPTKKSRIPILEIVPCDAFNQIQCQPQHLGESQSAKREPWQRSHKLFRMRLFFQDTIRHP